MASAEKRTYQMTALWAQGFKLLSILLEMSWFGLGVGSWAHTSQITGFSMNLPNTQNFYRESTKLPTLQGRAEDNGTNIKLDLLSCSHWQSGLFLCQILLLCQILFLFYSQYCQGSPAAGQTQAWLLAWGRDRESHSCTQKSGNRKRRGTGPEFRTFWVLNNSNVSMDTILAFLKASRSPCRIMEFEMVIPEISHFSLVYTANPGFCSVCPQQSSAVPWDKSPDVLLTVNVPEAVWAKPSAECQHYTNLHLKDIQVFRSPNLSSKSHSEPSLVPCASADLILVLTCVGDIATGNRQSQECKNKGM